MIRKIGFAVSALSLFFVVGSALSLFYSLGKESAAIAMGFISGIGGIVGLFLYVAGAIQERRRGVASGGKAAQWATVIFSFAICALGFAVFGFLTNYSYRT